MKRHFGAAAAVACALAAAAPAAALAHDGGGDQLRPGNLLVSGSTYREADIQPGVTQLPPGCTAANCVTATADGAYPYVFNNDVADGSFGVTSPILLWQLTPSGDVVSKIKVPTDQLVTSFSSKSELGLNVSTTGRAVTFMGYVARPRELDVSNSNTPGAVDPTNPVPGADYRAAARLDQWGNFSFTETNAYSGNNGRAAILNDEPGANVFYTAGNAGNGSNPQPAARRRGRGRADLQPVAAARVGPEPGRADPGGELQRHPARRQGRQDRQGRQLPRDDRVQQRPLLHQGQRLKRRRHRLLRRHHRQGVPQRHGRARRRGQVADDLDSV